MQALLHIRPLADQDIDRGFAYLHQENATQALAFLDALETSFQQLLDNPEIGSPRYAAILPVDGLRFWRVGKFPWLIFYLVTESKIDVVRILHGAQDIPQLLNLADVSFD